MGGKGSGGKGGYSGVTYASVTEHGQSGFTLFIGQQILQAAGSPDYAVVEAHERGVRVVPQHGHGKSIHRGRMFVNDAELAQLGLTLGVYDCSVQEDGSIVIDPTTRIDFDKLPQ